jgi:hypothetical protein
VKTLMRPTDNSTLIPAAYIFLCRDLTHDECLRENLFGGKEGYQKQTGEIKEGVTLFLYNFSSKLLEGAFVSTTKASFNIMPKAWKGKYPWQICVKRIHAYPPLMKSEIIPVFGNFDRFPKAVINDEKLKKLLHIFQEKSKLPEEEKLLRQQTPDVYFCRDGHKVRSKGEQTIDNWLYKARLSHAYEAELPFEGIEKNCDFLVHIPGKKDIYIEYWGMNTKTYKKNKVQKLSLYKEYQLDLIELHPTDIKNLDQILGKKLSVN